MVTQIQIHSGPSKVQPSIYSAKDNHLQMVWVRLFFFGSVKVVKTQLTLSSKEAKS